MEFKYRNEGPPQESFLKYLGVEGPPPLHKLDPWQQQVGGEHYKLPIQPLQYALANNLGIMEHAVVKYVTRHPSKGGKQDLEKARDYLDKMIAHYYS